MKLYDEYGNELRIEQVLGIESFDWARYDEGKMESMGRQLESLTGVVVNLITLLQNKGIQLTCDDINYLSHGTSGYKNVARIEVKDE